MIDRITMSSLREFQSKFGFSDNVNDQDLFEHFVNYIILEKKLDDRIDDEMLIDINIGKNGTIGIDGFCILINKQIVTSIEELKELLSQKNQPVADVFFIQAKTSNEFNTKDIASFGDAVEDFVATEQKNQWTEHASNSIELLKYLIDHANELENNPTCHIYYCTLGEEYNDKNIVAKKEKIIERIKKQKVFSNVIFTYFNFNDIQSNYKKIGRKISRKFNFPLKTLIPEIENVKEAYIGLIPATTIIDLIEEDSELIPSIFYDNVRDFQGFNPINSEIRETIEDNNLKYAFPILNNGITIVAEKLSQSRDNIEITNYQVINGLQTSRVLLQCKEHLSDKIHVALKLIITDDENIISKIIRATNRQTAVKEEDLIAYSEFQKNIEDFFRTFDEPNKLYYERRSKQYNSTDINSRSIIDKSTLIKVMGSFYFDKPHLATRYFSKLFNDFGHNLFKNNHELISYYTASLIYKRLELKFINGELDRKYRKLRYFMLMMLRMEYKKDKPTDLGSKKIKGYCETLLKELEDNDTFNQYLVRIIGKIDSLNLDLNDTEISKSAELVDKIKQLYFC
ncbi:AIPR family protein [Actinobacillus equuli subsp. haemolyticus]|uniref:AIPR family protein n=1 Tax=Actinobacillus equuli TaxID=718 RepID=UPI0024415D4B|nr:AIPR family protein [Actinobacillus equuli]WGE71718.1 AIPR family protein [Actinobacillus equuli subsp. haemolyticus]